MAHCRQELPRLESTRMAKPFTYSPPTKCPSVAVNTTHSCIVLSLDLEAALMSGPLQIRPSVWHVSISMLHQLTKTSILQITLLTHSYKNLFSEVAYNLCCAENVSN